MWGRRSSVYRGVDDSSHAIGKECYRQQKPRSDEVELLNHVHTDSDMVGEVHLKSVKDVKTGDGAIACGSEEAGDKRTKCRLVLYNACVEISEAISIINHILKMLYDVLEVHRILVWKWGFLDREISTHNVTMVQRRLKLNSSATKDRTPFVHDMLQAHRPEYSSTRGVEVDEDTHELAARTLRYPLEHSEYIARSVCLGQFFISGNSTRGEQMPKLSGRALELYQADRGMKHYERYNEKETMQGMPMHGGFSPEKYEETVSPGFYHRPEHDVESVFWTMFAVLARAQPASGPKEKHVPAMLRSVWKVFDTHEITSHPTVTEDKRDAILRLIRQGWREAFAPFPAMQDVADLLFEVSKHVRSEYALWEWVRDPEPDHLHEPCSASSSSTSSTTQTTSHWIPRARDRSISVFRMCLLSAAQSGHSHYLHARTMPERLSGTAARPPHTGTRAGRLQRGWFRPQLGTETSAM
ncbi:hypothetical protein GSI_09059 [Ganoderma sinense ZZ0214-1]|uniref:Fungal-type protein kinase domain-containing protein n=1 Tax=Ganoderma sinense ZZ0214-1 TaxID=1077348 RepID=A0A2G8S5H2_9APHY|nr:hypothetical protein GSI_09059 [Ganoderma sinense ZZ0214-1]